MKIDDAELKRLLQEGMDYEADCIMEEVESDPNIQDVVAPEEIYDNLLKQIREREDELEKEKEALSREQQELIRLGKIYKKKRGRRKYIVLIAAVVCALGVGTISFGDKSKVFTELQRMLGDRKQTVVNTDDGNGSVVDEIASEAEAYSKIEEEFGFVPVKMFYLPDGMEYAEAVVEEEKQSACIYYIDGSGKSISYRVITNYRTGSVGNDIEDVLIKEYDMEIHGITISIGQYQIKGNDTLRWVVSFNYENAQYTIMFMEMEENEVENIVKDLYFP